MGMESGQRNRKERQVHSFADLGKLVSAGAEVQPASNDVGLDSTQINNAPKLESAPLESQSSDLIEQYKSENPDVFRDENGKFKPLKVIASEIETILKAEKSVEQVENFMKVILPRHRSVISSLNKELKAEKSVEEKAEASKQIKKAYSDLLYSAAYALHNEFVPKGNREAKPNSKNIEELYSSFTELKSRFIESGGRVKDSKRCLEIQKILGYIEKLNEREIDPAVKRIKESKYLKLLKRNLDLFEKEIGKMTTKGGGRKQGNQGIEVGDSLDTESEVVDDYVPKNLPIAKEEVFAGDLAEDVVRQPDVSYVSRNNTEETIDANQYSVFSGDLAEDVVKQPETSYLSRPDNSADNTISLDLDIYDEKIKGFVRRSDVDALPIKPIEQSNLSNIIEDKDIAVETKEKSEWRKAKEVYVNSEKEYNEALNKYYKNYSEQYYADKSLTGKIGRSVNTVKKFFGLKPELPLDIDLLTKKENYRQARSEYLPLLDKALKNRAGYGADGKTLNPEAKNYDFSLSSDSNADLNKMRFGKKFILDPNKERLERQKQLMSPEEQRRLANIMAVMAKNKWLIRGGFVAVAGGVGFVSGGLGAAAFGAAYKAGKMTASTFLGGFTGTATKKWMQDRIDKTLSEAEAKTNGFSIRGLDRIEDELLKAYDEIEIKEMRKNAAGIAAAAATGFATGAGARFLDDTPDNPSAYASSVTPSVDNTAKAIEELSKANSGEDHNVPNYSSDEPSVREEVSPEENEVPEKYIQELQPDKYTVHDSLGNPTYVLTLSGVSFDGDGFKIPDSELKNVENEVAATAAKIISEDPNITKEQLEVNVTMEIQNKFIANDWWDKTANVFPKIKIGEWYLASAEDDVLGVKDNTIINSTESVENVLSTDESDVAGEVGLDEEREIYQTNSGEDLRTILSQVYSEKLDGLNEYQKAAVLDRTMSMVRVDEDLKNSLGLKSGDPELIYGGENIDLTLLGKELEHLADLSSEDVSSLSSGVLPVVSETEVSAVPIKVTSPDLDTGFNTAEDDRDYVAEFVENKSQTSTLETNNPLPEEIPPPRPFSLSANYFNASEYQQFVEQKFGGVDRFNQIVNRTVENFDDSTYDYFEKSAIFGKDYVSPYDYMGEMSLAEIDELSERSPDEIKNILEKENIKYETYLAWLDKVNEMKEKLPNDENTLLNDLYSRYVAETVDGKGNLIKSKI